MKQHSAKGFITWIMLLKHSRTYVQHDKTMEVSVTPFFQPIFCLELIAQLVGIVNVPVLLLCVLSVPLSYELFGNWVCPGIVVKVLSRKKNVKNGN